MLAQIRKVFFISILSFSLAGILLFPISTSAVSNQYQTTSSKTYSTNYLEFFNGGAGAGGGFLSALAGIFGAFFGGIGSILQAVIEAISSIFSGGSAGAGAGDSLGLNTSGAQSGEGATTTASSKSVVPLSGNTRPEQSAFSSSQTNRDQKISAMSKASNSTTRAMLSASNSGSGSGSSSGGKAASLFKGFNFLRPDSNFKAGDTFTSKLTAYTPGAGGIEGGKYDRNSNVVSNRFRFQDNDGVVIVAMDSTRGGAPQGHFLVSNNFPGKTFLVHNTGSAFNGRSPKKYGAAKGTTRMDIAVTPGNMYQSAFNGNATFRVISKEEAYKRINSR